MYARLAPQVKKPADHGFRVARAQSVAAGSRQATAACPCGGGCPRCAGRINPTRAGAGPAVAAAPAAAPAVAPTTLQCNDAAAPAYNNIPGQELFRWDVNFATSARNAWIVQHVQSIWNVERCDNQPYQGWTAGVPDVEADYWEAWWVDASGSVLIPKSTATPPLATGTPIGADDQWVRQPNSAEEPTFGNWGLVADLYVTPTLAPEFKIRGVVTAKHLASTKTPPSTPLGKVLAHRDVGGIWNFCPSGGKPWHYDV